MKRDSSHQHILIILIVVSLILVDLQTIFYFSVPILQLFYCSYISIK